MVIENFHNRDSGVPAGMANQVLVVYSFPVRPSRRPARAVLLEA